MTAYLNKSFAVPQSGRDPETCNHGWRRDNGDCVMCGAPANTVIREDLYFDGQDMRVRVTHADQSTSDYRIVAARREDEDFDVETARIARDLDRARRRHERLFGPRLEVTA